ncbi:hypothetical protein CHS0354_021084 [Potamilus streckersoni]|uniref:Lariat debranching enzyme C-terminal domain-containing protein n=1 Tax=Potamilus streckersoni TaxID=2493646 RepID=A0AAE0VUK4_9BIVA|nr:hypothetical protein CHS0354_021084 [Potamilus streckersoni]
MKIAVEGCCHGELDKIYETLKYIENLHNYKIDLLLICGDFQAVRNKSDMQCMAVPQKYQKMNTFYKYYSGEKKAPVLTVFIGGNHEASNYMQELPYGGWVAPNIYYMGYAGMINVGGIRIGGLSGIYKGRDFHKGHFEHPPYTEESKRTAYHIRSIDAFRLKQVTRTVNIMMTHDWPRGIYNYGDVQGLLKFKKFLKEEIENNTLGSPPAMELLLKLKPQYWFSAHLHAKFAAVLQHDPSDDAKITKFLSLDKCLPRRHFLQVIDVPHDVSKPIELMLDPEWLAILKSTNHLLNLTKTPHYLPGPGCNQRYDFTVSDEEIDGIYKDFGGDLLLPKHFKITVPRYDPSDSLNKAAPPPQTTINEQTTLLCTMLDITDPNAVFLGKDSHYKIPESFGKLSEAKQDEDIDDDIDEDYESEMSFVSFSESEQNSSILSAGNDSLSSTANDSIVSAGNHAGVSLGDDDDVDDDMVSKMAAEGNDKIDVTEYDEDDELQAILSAQNDLRMKLESAKSADFKSTGDIEMMHKGCIENTHKTLNFSDILSASSASETEVIAEKESRSQSSSLSNTSMEMKFLEINVKEDEDELQEILKVQREEKLKESQTNKMQSDTQEVSIFGDTGENLNDNSGLVGDQSVSDFQKELEHLKPVHQSSPAVCMGECIDVSKKLGVATRLEASFEKAGFKRGDNSVNASPEVKKLKRRNQSLYTDVSEEVVI